MDLNADGHIDVLSGSYSRSGGPMAGLFQVLWGTGRDPESNAPLFKAAEPLTSDGEAVLVIQDPKSKGGGADISLICTRPFACDLDGDGHMDVVTGNFGGEFAVFYGEAGGGFDAACGWLKDDKGKRLKVQHHSDPFLIDWDADGDLDLLSGSSSGGVNMFVNSGTKTEPKFGASVVLLKTGDRGDGKVRLGEAHIKGPQGSTRVWATDYNGDGKLDLLVGDALQLAYGAKGLSEKEVHDRLAQWEASQGDLPSMPDIKDWDKMSEEEEAAYKVWSEANTAHFNKRKEFLREVSSGSVWVALQK